MIKKLICLLGIAIPSFLIASNSISLQRASGEDVTNTVYTVTGPSTTQTFEEDLYVTNNTDTTVKIRVRRKQILVNPNSIDYFCWFQCYGPPVNVDPPNNFILVQQNETNYENFHAYFKPQGIFGLNRIRYTFFNNVPGHLDDSAFVEIIFDVASVMPPDPILLQIPNSGFITNSDVNFSFQIDTSNQDFISDMVYPLSITNNTNIIKQLIVKKRELSIIEGSQNFFSWHATFNPTVMEDTAGYLMYPNTTISGEFKAIYRSNGNLGESVIQYVVYNKFDPSDSSFVNVHFNVVYSGLTDAKKEHVRLELAPNPANTFTTLYFDKIHDEMALLSIVNLCGEEVANYSIASSQTRQKIDVQNLNNGVYFCRLSSNAKNISTIKLVVAK